MNKYWNNKLLGAGAVGVLHLLILVARGGVGGVVWDRVYSDAIPIKR